MYNTYMKIKKKKENIIGTLSIVAMIYSIIASGAFGIEEMIPECGPGLTIIILAGLALVFALPFALLCARAGSARPDEGGSLLWVKEFLGEFWFGIMVIIQCIWSLVCNAIYIVLATEYIRQIIPMNEICAYILKFAIVLVFFLINILGIKESSRVENILVAATLIAFLVLTIVGFKNWTYNPMLPVFSGAYETKFSHIGEGFAIGMWMYAGFDELSVLSGEVKDSAKLFPKAILIAVPLIAASNIFPTLAGLASIGEWESWTTNLSGVGYVTVMARYLGPLAANIFVFIAATCKFASFNTILATDSRCIMVMAEENFGPDFLAKTNKYGVPYWSLIFVSIVTVLLIPFSFKALVILDVFFTIVVTLLTLAAIYVMNKKLEDKEFGFKTPGGKNIQQGLIILVALVCIFGLLVNGADWFLGGLWWTMCIPILYIICKKKFGGCTKDEPNLYPINTRTGLGFGDEKRIGLFYFVLGIFAVLSRFFIEWYEKSWAYEYYQEANSGLFSSFDFLINAISITGVVLTLTGSIVLLFTNKGKTK